MCTSLPKTRYFSRKWIQDLKPKQKIGLKQKIGRTYIARVFGRQETLSEKHEKYITLSHQSNLKRNIFVK